MRATRVFIILVVSLFLIGTIARTDTLADGWKQAVADHEQRISDLETDIDGLTTRMGDAEARLDVLEQNPPMRSGIMSVPPGAFIPKKHDTWYEIEGLRLGVHDHDERGFSAALYLPDSAVITRFSVEGRDTSTAGRVIAGILVFYNGSSGGTYSRLALAGTLEQTEAPGYFMRSVDVDETVDNALYAYSIELDIENGGAGWDSALFYRAVIEYSYPE